MTTREAAESLGLSVRQVQHLIKHKRLKATKPLGSDAWDVDISDYKPRAPGRPLGSVAKPKPLSVEERLEALEGRVAELEERLRGVSFHEGNEWSEYESYLVVSR